MRAQVVGWPPIRSFRKNTLATISKNNEEVDGWPPIRSFSKNTLATNSKNNEVDGKPSSLPLFVMGSMDGAPYTRKCGPHGVPGREMTNESKLRDLLHRSEYVLSYEDRDGDWMLIGDVPWEMFIDSCRRLRIMKSSDAIGLGSDEIESDPKDMESDPLVESIVLLQAAQEALENDAGCIILPGYGII